MGGAIVQRINLSAELERRAKEARPSYYIDKVKLDVTDMEITRKSWQIIMTSANTVPYLQAMEDNPHFSNYSLLTWFFDIFYEKFFSLCPEARDSFSAVSMVTQSRLMAGVISSSLGLLNRPTILTQRLTAMVIRHFQRGVRAVQYSFMGEALLWSLDRALGDDFTASVQYAWTRVYSYLLSIILPAAIAAESEAENSDSSEIKIISSEKYPRNHYK